MSWHFIEHNHSSRFWKLVADAMPDYRVQENGLERTRIYADFEFLDANSTVS
ncbi:MAG: M48 family metallopeptidase [Saprospiraceae bacterium]|nr:M48 family metallopeptidase [Saprospiraceae bacterium]